MKMNAELKMYTVLKCRKCKVEAEDEESDGTITLIRCPRCGTEIAGEHANKMYQKHGLYLAAKYFLEDPNVPLKPGPALVEPDWEFFFDVKDREE